MLLADYSIAFVLLLMGVLTVLITMLVCMVKMSRELEDLNDSMSSIARTLHNLRRDASQIEARSRVEVESAQQNSRSEIPAGSRAIEPTRNRESKPPNRRPGQSTASARLDPEQRSRRASRADWQSDDQDNVDEARQRHGHADDLLEASDFVETSDDEFDRGLESDFERDESDVEFESANGDEGSSPAPCPVPRNSAAALYLDATAAASKAPSIAAEDDIVIDDGDDCEIVYIENPRAQVARIDEVEGLAAIDQ